MSENQEILASQTATYHYAGFSQGGLFFTGEISVADDTPLDRVAIKVAHEMRPPVHLRRLPLGPL